MVQAAKKARLALAAVPPRKDTNKPARRASAVAEKQPTAEELAQAAEKAAREREEDEMIVRVVGKLARNKPPYATVRGLLCMGVGCGAWGLGTSRTTPQPGG